MIIYKDNRHVLPSLHHHRLLRRSAFHKRWNHNERYIVESLENPAVNSSRYSPPHPRLKSSRTNKLQLNPKLYKCRDRYEGDTCINKTMAYRERLIRMLEEHLTTTANDEQQYSGHEKNNFYNVQYKPIFGESFEEQYYPSTCLVMEAGVRVLKRQDPPFDKLQFGKLLPKQKIFAINTPIKTCAIVSSAGSMSGSKLGKFIGKISTLYVLYAVFYLCSISFLFIPISN